jgi:hypothetical protein
MKFVSPATLSRLTRIDLPGMAPLVVELNVPVAGWSETTSTSPLSCAAATPSWLPPAVACVGDGGGFSPSPRDDPTELLRESDKLPLDLELARDFMEALSTSSSLSESPALLARGLSVLSLIFDLKLLKLLELPTVSDLPKDGRLLKLGPFSKLVLLADFLGVLAPEPPGLLD